MPSRVDSRRKLGREVRIRQVNILGIGKIVTAVGCACVLLHVRDRIR